MLGENAIAKERSCSIKQNIHIIHELFSKEKKDCFIENKQSQYLHYEIKSIQIVHKPDKKTFFSLILIRRATVI